MNVEETPLPGIGTRKDLVTESGSRVGVVAYRDGQTELIVSKPDDPDACLASIPLTRDEASALGNLLGGHQIVMQLTEEHSEFPGVVTRQFSIMAGSPYDNRPMGDAHLRTRTKVSVVAVMRAGQVQPSPSPDFVLRAGDLLVAVGTLNGLDAAAEILRNG